MSAAECHCFDIMIKKIFTENYSAVHYFLPDFSEANDQADDLTNDKHCYTIPTS